MNTHDFIKRYDPYTYKGLKQASIDLFEEIEETLMDIELPFDTRLGAVSYKISTALEVYNDELKDRTWLVDMYNDLDKIANKGV